MKFTKTYAFITILAAGALGVSGIANASAIVVQGTCDVTDVQLNTAYLPNPNYADQCAGVFEGNVGSGDAGIIDGHFGPAWQYLLASDSNLTGTFNGIEITLGSVVDGGTSGIWTLAWSDTNGGSPANLPYWLDLAIVIKAGNGYATYLFDDLKLAAEPDTSGQGTWDVVVEHFNSQTENSIIPGLSHLALFVRETEQPVIPLCERDPSNALCEQTIPEPETLALLGIGLLGLGASLKRKPQR